MFRLCQTTSKQFINDSGEINMNQLVELQKTVRAPRGLADSAVGHRSIAPGFKPRPGYIKKIFHLTFCLITFGGRSAHLASIMHKRGLKTAITF